MFLFIYFQKLPNNKITKVKSRVKICGKLFKKRFYLQRHEKKFHPAALERRTEDDKEWLKQDPGELIGEVSNESESSSSNIDSSEEEEIVEESKMIQYGRDNEFQEPQEIKKEEDKAGEENSSSLEKGKIIRKLTIRVPVFAPQKGAPLNLPVKNVPLNRFKFSLKCSTST